jgi:hypothetical protein
MKSEPRAEAEPGAVLTEYDALIETRKYLLKSFELLDGKHCEKIYFELIELYNERL